MHLHSSLSNGITNIDSVTKYQDYISKCKQEGMRGIGFSEHGSIFEWWHKKCAIESAGMIYIHAIEAYITESIENKIRDNMHCVLISKNYDGFLELNRLVSNSFNRDDGHFYYNPRISFDELINTSDNIIITTACLGGILSKGTEDIKRRFLEFLIHNKHRCFLEAQHHLVESQCIYNKYLATISKKYDIPLIAGTDTHALNQTHMEGRKKLQEGKGVYFSEEENWDLSFKTYDELVTCYKIQNALSESEYLEAIENTNKLLDMIEPFQIDKDIKYPKLYDNPTETFKQKINEGYKKHKYIKQRYSKEEIKNRVNMELDAYEKTNSINFMLLQTYMREWEKKHNILCGYGRGSVSGSEIAYILSITEMDSIKFGLNFFRFMNPSRVTNADIDTDYSSVDRERVKEFLLKDHMELDQIATSEIITFNTIALKGAIKDIGRALKMKLSEVQEISDAVYQDEKKNFTIDNQWREQYPELFKYVDIVNGTIVSIGTHPSGVLISDRNIREQIGMCSSSTSKYQISMLNMKELDDLMYVKLDILGLDNIGLINETCKMLDIERLTPDNVDLNDEDVWKSIRDDTTLIFQWESNSAQSYLKKFMSDDTLNKVKSLVQDFQMIKWFSYGNGLIRPACESYRDEVANGEFYSNDFKELDDFLAPTMGRVTMQEDIMQFLVKFCGYSDAESDNVRRLIAKRIGTEKVLPEIEQRFINYSSQKYNVTKEQCAEIIKPFLEVILAASAYSFSWNHSDSYSCTGYICGYLRYYYPLQFLTCALNIFDGDEEKTITITKYANKNGITISPIKFRHSISKYTCDVEKKMIYKGMSSIKYLNKRIASELYGLKDKHFNDFIDLLKQINKTSINSKQLDILVKLDYFEEFGEINTLLKQIEVYNNLNDKKQIRKDQIEELGLNTDFMNTIGCKCTDKIYKDFDFNELIYYVINNTECDKTSVSDKINYEREFLGYIHTTIPTLDLNYVYVSGYECKFKNPKLTLYHLATGDIEVVKVKKDKYDLAPIEVGNIIKVIETKEDGKWHKNKDGEWEQNNNDKETILLKWGFVKS